MTRSEPVLDVYTVSTGSGMRDSFLTFPAIPPETVYSRYSLGLATIIISLILLRSNVIITIGISYKYHFDKLITYSSSALIVYL